MTKIWIVLIVFNLVSVCSLFQESSRLQLQEKSIDPLIAMNQIAELLNVSSSDNWANYMEQPISNGSMGVAQVSSSTIDSVMATWSIPKQFHDEAVKCVKLLILAASKGHDSAQSFVFSERSGALLTTLLIVAKKISQPIDLKSSVAITYATISTDAVLKPLYTQYYEKRCSLCSILLVVGRSCCTHVLNYAPRYHTIEEFNIIRTKLMADQFRLFWERDIPQFPRKNVTRNRFHPKTHSYINPRK